MKRHVDFCDIAFWLIWITILITVILALCTVNNGQ